MSNSNSHTRRSTSLLAYVMVLLFGLSFVACMSSDEGSVNARNPYENNVKNGDLFFRAEQALKRHDPRTAQNEYAKALAEPNQRHFGVAATGKALTDLMLLLGEDTARQIVSQGLAADRKSYDIQQLLWAKEGMLFWFSDNIPWEDSASYKGVRSIMSDKLPFKGSRLESVDAFVAPLNQSVNTYTEDLVALANALAAIETSLGNALKDDKFTHYYIPYQVFHDDRLGLVIGRPEIHLLRGTIAVLRTGLYMVAAYDHRWTPLQLFSRTYWEGVANDPAHPDHIDGMRKADDYLARYANTHILRDIREPLHLEAARRAFKAGFESYAKAMEAGASAKRPNTLGWRKVDPQMLEKLSRMFKAISQSADGPTVIPYVSPEMTVNMNVLFKDGRVLEPELNWLVEQSQTMSPGGEGIDVPLPTNYALNEDALNAFTKGIITPDPEQVEYTIELDKNDGLTTFKEQLYGEWVSSLEEAYNIQ